MSHVEQLLANTPAAAVDISKLLDHCAALTNELSHIPAVPTIDWCDRAAHVFGAVVTNKGAGCAILDLQSGGVIKTVLATGADASVSIANEKHQHVSNAIRFTLESLPKSSMLPGLDYLLREEPNATLEQAVSGHVLLGSQSDEAFLNKWGAEGEMDMLWAMCPLNGRIRGRMLVGYVAADNPPQSNESIRLLLQSCVTLAAKLASNALSCTDSEGNVAWLTPREQDVLERLVEGKSVREISDELERSQHTVHDYVKSLHRKLGATSRGELVAKVLGHVNATGHYSRVQRKREDFKEEQ